MGVPKAWLADLRTLVGSGSDRAVEPDKPVLGILAFESAATMARLVCLHRSLSSSEIQRLRSDTMRSQGVAYLNSTDQFLLLCLASAEFMTELDTVASVVARMGLKCRSLIPLGFAKLYNDVKNSGVSGSDLDRLGLGSSGKSVEKMMKRMERYVVATSKLLDELDALNELESNARNQSRRNSGPIPVQKPDHVVTDNARATVVDVQSMDPIQVELRLQSSKVKRLKDESLWNKTYDKAVELMARAVVTVFAKICSVFSPTVPGLPDKIKSKSKDYRILAGKHSSGPIERPLSKDVAIVRNSAPIYVAKAAITNTLLGKWGKILDAPPNTVGASGLSLRYANIIVTAEKLLAMRKGETEYDEEEEAAIREEIYGMLPVAMKGAVRSKLREFWRREGGRMDGSMADGWKEAVEGILGWLGSVARDTLRWHEERSMEKGQRFVTRPRSLLLHTLHFSNKDKTSAAIVEVLVGLSCVCWSERLDLN